MVAGDREHVAELPPLQGGAQVRVVAIDLVAGHPLGRYSRVQGALDHLLGKLGLGREDHILRNGGLAAPLRGTRPGLGQVERAVDGSMPVPGGVSEIDDDLGVLDSPGGAGVLALHSHGVGSFLQVPGLVGHQHGLIVGQVFQHERTQVVTDEVGVPFGSAEQVLQAIWAGIPSMLGDRPAVLAWQVCQHSEHQLPGATPGFNPREAARYPGHQALEHHPPACRHHAVTCGHRFIVSPHLTMITDCRSRLCTGPHSKITSTAPCRVAVPDAGQQALLGSAGEAVVQPTAEDR